MGRDGGNIVENSTGKNRTRNARSRIEKMEKIDITGIAVEKIYYIETEEPGFESLVRYSEDQWFVLYEGKELAIDPVYVEENFQKLLLLNSISFN